MTPGVRLADYVSYSYSPYHIWCVELGYPLLDVVKQESGEWGLRQFDNTPLIPAETRWRWVVQPQHRYQLSFGAVKQMTDQLDVEKRYVWDELEKRERQDAEDFKSEDRHHAETKARMHKIIRGNPALMERLARNGQKELALRSVFKNVPRHMLRKASNGHASTGSDLPKPAS